MMKFKIPRLLPSRKALCLLSLLLVSTLATHAREGMWMPSAIKEREAEMKRMGLQIPVEQLYNDQGTGLNQAVVLFGKGCTGEVISDRGLLLTNHHCGYGTVQGLSSKDKDYFANGFWAMNNSEELACPGLTVTFIRSMENVTDQILSGLPDTMRETLRDSLASARVRVLEGVYKKISGMDAAILPFYQGNQFWVMVSETFSDIRLVGFPPNGIGQFGGDTDNWMWPRHTGDFSLFRIYADKKGKPAEYSAANLPYKPKKSFAINIGGIKEGDFTMVYGFPGTTQEYISGAQLDQVYRISDPIRIEARTRKLGIWNAAMETDRDVFLKYTSKKARVANGWKKWQGEVRGLQINDVPAKKEAYEAEFAAWASVDTTLPYADNLLAAMNATILSANQSLKGYEYINEAVYGVELIAQSAALDKMILAARKSAVNSNDAMVKAAGDWKGFFKNYDPALDEKVFVTMLSWYAENVPEFMPPAYKIMLASEDNNYERWASKVYSTSLFANENRFSEFMSNLGAADTSRIYADAGWQLYNTMATLRSQKVLPALLQNQNRMTRLNRLYMAAQMKKDVNKAFYPDASLTLRLTYGQIKGIDPDGPAGYSYQTYLSEVMAKDQQDVAEFKVPQKLKDLYARKDFGRWQVNGNVPVCFIADNHTSGGNSGSPVINGKGQLIGTNFDRIWEGTMSDLYFDPNLCRNISVDIRYTLFIIEKFGNAGWLLKEMKLVKK